MATKKTATTSRKGTTKATPAPRAGKRATKPRNGSGKKVTAKKMSTLRDTLLVLREQLTNQMKQLRESSLKRNDLIKSIEDGGDAFEMQVALQLASSEQESVIQIDEALRRIDEGTYGACEECGGGIEIPRLEALPFVRTCITCQSAIEEKNGVARSAALRRL